ncbi:MAG TPA: chemotaxis protein CheW [Gemmatimonadaceae bacterium]|nr:chemotaxis protein CheW [Gemmatimonadaceae bacterium]
MSDDLRTPIDWDELRRRTGAAHHWLAELDAPSPERVRATLAARASALARRVASPEPDDHVELVQFRLAGERFALESIHVLEVFRLRTLTMIPGSTPPVFAVTIRQGALLTLIDLRLLLGRSVSALNDLTTVLTIRTEQTSVGLLVDAVEDIVQLRTQDIHPSDPTDSRPWLRGTTNDAVTVLNAGRLLRSHP